MKKMILCLLIVMINNICGAVHTSENNTGKMLVFPYYNLDNRFSALTNSSHTAQIVTVLQVEFTHTVNVPEADASDWHLTPNDAWVGALVKGIMQWVESTRLITNDFSCTVPLINGSESLVHECHMISLTPIQTLAQALHQLDIAGEGNITIAHHNQYNARFFIKHGINTNKL